MIDTHHHALPPAYYEALDRIGGDPSGYSTPEWSVNATIESMNQLGTEFAILSLSTPGVPIAGTGQEGRDLARSVNEYLGDVVTDPEYVDRLDFFGTLPDWRDVEGAVEEIDFLFSSQGLCLGVAIESSYGDQLLGNSTFAPIWEKLNEYKAWVFLHPTLLPGIVPTFIAGGLPQPIVDYPLATTRSAIDLVFSGRMTSIPDVDIILAHAGGTVPFLGSRALGSLTIPDIAESVNVSCSDAQRAFDRFYYDIAGSTSTAQLNGLLDFSNSSQILFGSDFPYVPQPGINAMVAEYTGFVSDSPRGSEIRPEV